MAEFVGFPGAGGAFTSGGTISNVSAIAAARERALPGSRLAGLAGARVAVYCSQEVHYSVTRAVELLGIGSNNLRAVALDGLRRMRPEALADSIDADLARGITPIAVIASAGTTLTGAIDPLEDIARVCGDRKVWLHVDGAYGLPAAAVASRADDFRGFELADSCSVDAHKWLYLPKACGVVLVRDADSLARAFAHEQGYLPHQQHELHAVDTTLEYSRPFRALKLWLAFRAHGAAQFRNAIAQNFEEAALLYRRAQATEDFEVMEAPPRLSIVPLRHVPPDVGDVNAHNLALAEAIQADGRVYLSSALIDGEVWLRPCFVNFRTTEDDVLALLDVARELGERLAGKGAPRDVGGARGPLRRRLAARRAEGRRRPSTTCPWTSAPWAPSRTCSAAPAAIRRHMEAKVLAPDRLSWTSFVGLWVLWVWGEMEAREFAAAVGISRPTATGRDDHAGGPWVRRRDARTAADGRMVLVSLTAVRPTNDRDRCSRSSMRRRSAVAAHLVPRAARQLAAMLRSSAPERWLPTRMTAPGGHESDPDRQVIRPARRSADRSVGICAGSSVNWLGLMQIVVNPRATWPGIAASASSRSATVEASVNRPRVPPTISRSAGCPSSGSHRVV